MALSWGDRRKYTYLTFVGIICLVILYFIYTSFFSAPATCFDTKQNGGEEGIDCGGSCALICANQSHDPSAAWSRAFLTASSTYTAAALIQNANAGAGAHNVQYSFKFYDASNNLIVEHDGVTDLPPLSSIPIIDPGIQTGVKTVARTLFAFSELPVWQKVSKDTLPVVSVTNQVLASDGSRLSLMLANSTVHDYTNITIAAVLYDAQGVALAASKSFIKALPHRTSQQITFTWPLSVPGVVRAELTVLPSF